MIWTPPVLGLLGVLALGAVLMFLKEHVASIRRGEPLVVRGGVYIPRTSPAYRRLVALSFVSYAVALVLSLTLIAAVIARMQDMV